jgi:hypothetical protein
MTMSTRALQPSRSSTVSMRWPTTTCLPLGVKSLSIPFSATKSWINIPFRYHQIVRQWRPCTTFRLTLHPRHAFRSDIRRDRLAILILYSLTNVPSLTSSSNPRSLLPIQTSPHFFTNQSISPTSRAVHIRALRFHVRLLSSMRRCYLATLHRSLNPALCTRLMGRNRTIAFLKICHSRAWLHRMTISITTPDYPSIHLRIHFVLLRQLQLRGTMLHPPLPRALTPNFRYILALPSSASVLLLLAPLPIICSTHPSPQLSQRLGRLRQDPDLLFSTPLSARM